MGVGAIGLCRCRRCMATFAYSGRHSLPIGKPNRKRSAQKASDLKSESACTVYSGPYCTVQSSFSLGHFVSTNRFKSVGCYGEWNHVFTQDSINIRVKVQYLFTCRLCCANFPPRRLLFM
jgi:hypothetical protein